MKRIIKAILFIILGLILLLGGFLYFLQTEKGQIFVSNQLTTYLEKTLKTKVKAQISFDFPDFILLENVLIEDQKKDTLLAAKKIYVKIKMWELLQNQEIKSDTIFLQNISLKANRNSKDFNYQFIIDAFAPDTTKPKVPSKSYKIELGVVKLENIRVDFQDNFLKNTAKLDLKHFKTQFEKFNLEKQQFFVKDIDLEGIELISTLINPEISEKKTDEKSQIPDFKFSSLNLKKINYNLDLQAFNLKSKANINHFEANTNNIDLPKNLISFKSILLQNSFISYENTSKQKQKTGFDAHNLVFENLNLVIENLNYSPKNTNLKLKKLGFSEKSGLKLENLKSDFILTENKISLQNLFLKTPQTTIQNDFVIEFKSFEDIAKNFNQSKIDLNLKESKVSMQDIFRLLPDLAQNTELKKIQNETFRIEGKTNGKISDLNFKNLIIKGLDNSFLSIDGNVKEITNTEKLNFQLNLNRLNIQKNTIDKFLPSDAVPSSIALPENFDLKGKIVGNLQNIDLNTTILTDFGEIIFDGNINIPKTKINAETISGNLALQNFNLGKLLKQPENIGDVSLKTSLNVSSFDPNQMQIDAKGLVEKAFYNNYTYQNLDFDASFKNKILDLKTIAKDPNLNLDLVAKIDLSKEFPALIGKAKIEKIDFQKLHLYSESLGLKGNFDFDIKNSNPENLEANLISSQSVIYKDNQNIEIGNLDANLAPFAGGIGGKIKTDFANFTFKSSTNLENLPNAILTEINKYFQLPSISYLPQTNPYQISLDGYLKNHPAIQVFVPELKALDSLQFDALFDNQSDSSLQINAFLPYSKYDSNAIKLVKLHLLGNGTKANYNIDLQEFTNGDLKVRKANLKGEVENNIAKFIFSVKDSLDRPIHGIAGNLKSENKHILIGLQPRGTMLNFKNWQAEESGYIDFSEEGFFVKNLVLRSEKQSLQINSVSEKPNAPLNIQADSLDLQTLLTAFLQDSTLAAGKIYGNGNFIVKNGSFTGDFRIKDFAVSQILVGDLALSMTNESADRIHAKGTLKSDKNDIDLEGNYFIEKENPLDLTLNIKRLGAETVQAFSFETIKKAKGNLNGKLSIKGKTESPNIVGELNFNEMTFVLPQTQATYKIDAQKLQFDGQNIFLKNFIIQDTLKQNLIADGSISIKNLPDVSYNLNIKANNFLALNTTRKDNDFVFGKAKINPQMNIQGTGSNYKINGKVKVNEGSLLTMIMPDEVGSAGNNEEIVQFINVLADETPTKTLVKTSIEAAKSTNGSISLNLEADDKSELKIIIDELNGDYLKAKGNANLTTQINEAGQMTMTGKYEISEGTYEMTYQVLKKPFTIKKGSEIVWVSDPMKGNMHITAQYAVNAPVYDLMVGTSKDNPSEAFKKEFPFSVNLIMTGELLAPKVDFDIVFDESYVNSLEEKDKNDLQTTLENLRKNPFELKKQVFTVLMLGRFIPEKSADFFSGVSAESIARQSVSKLLSEQLNRFAGSIIKGVKLDVNVNSEYNSTSDFRSTNLNVGLSKSFLNERLSVSVGRNFELENAQARSNEVFDNLTLNYNLTKDGRYRFKAFRRNQFILEGFVVETGVGFTIAMDFDQMKELLGKN